MKLVSEKGEALKTIKGYIITVNKHVDLIATSAKAVCRAGGGQHRRNGDRPGSPATRRPVEETSAASTSLANESGRVRELISQFQLGGLAYQKPSVAVAAPAHRAVQSPVRRLTGHVARAFSGNAAVKEAGRSSKDS